ncbi:uncharacterized protein [Brachyistius frenatus]|uniref:uncharacterized protein n=1 Tax=Brachyistius frenatus TaxID=100188 RepID=UPI0037E957C6
MPIMRVSKSQSDVGRQKPTIFTPDGFRQAYSPADGLAVRDPGKRTVQLVQCRLSCTEEDRKQEVIGGSVMNLLSSQPSYRSCIHHEVPLRSASSVVFLDKSLCLSFVELEGRRAGRPTLYTSAMSVRLGVSSCRRTSTDNKSAKTNEGYGRTRAAMLANNKRNGRDSGLGPLSKHRGRKVEQMAPAYGVNSKADDSDTQRHSATVGLLSFRGPSPSNTKVGRLKGNADEAASCARSNSRRRQPTFSTSPVDSRTRSKQAGGDKTGGGQDDCCSTEPQTVSTLDKTCYYYSRLKADYLESTPNTLSLKEALELFRPDFISRSQGRVRRLEQRAQRRRALQDSNPDLVQGLREGRGKQKRNCTTPDPLSDNLFKPRERSISGREMQLRSRRIYNKLPEVTKKKEEEKKRAVSQTNRLRAEVFKKRLLDQILQR